MGDARRPAPPERESIAAARERRVREQRERDQRERERRERERRRAASSTSPSRPAPRTRHRTGEQQSEAAVAVREPRAGIVTAVGRAVAQLPALVAGVLRGFALEVLAVLVGMGRGLVRMVPGRDRIGRAGGAVAERARSASATLPTPGTLPRRTSVTQAPRRERTESEQRAFDRRRQLLRRRLRIALAVGVVVSALLAWIYVPASDAFRIRHVEISGASAVGDLEARVRIDRLLRGETVYTVDEERVAAKLEELPFVREARVERHLPGGLEVHLVEYRPLAIGYGDGHFWLIARDGRILSRARRQEWLGRVPVVTLGKGEIEPGMRVTDEPAMQVLAERPSGSTLAIESVSYEAGALRATLDSGVIVRFGRPDVLVQKLLVAEEMLRRARRDDLGDLVYIDVTVPSKPAVCPASRAECVAAAERDAAEAEEAAGEASEAGDDEGDGEASVEPA